MNILLIGPGSIGKRHYRNLTQLGYTNITVVSRSGILPQELSHSPVYTNINDALAARLFDAAILCTPTASHASDLLLLLKASIPNLYVEKPVSHSLENLEEILQLSQSYPNNIVVGFDLHFDPGLQKVNELLKADAIGKLVSVNAQVGQYLPDWRPHEDYHKGMSARQETGGGVMLDLVHEFDYLRWLLGTVNTIAALHQNSGALHIETEDVAEVLLSFNNGIIGTIHLDYLQQQLVRNCMITGYKGTIFWNLAENAVRVINADKEEEVFSFSHYERNDRFLAIMQAFLESGTDERLTTLEQGIESLKMVLAAKRSSSEKAFIHL